MPAHEELLALDRRHVWHPFTQMQAWPDDDPLIIAGAEGNYLIDDLGRRYFDGVSSLWVTVHGHKKREIDDAVRAQLDRIASPHGDAGKSLREAEALFARRGNEIAALVVEPLVQGAAGMLVQPKGYLARLAELCRAHEVLLICDEVATGFGRTGTMF